MLPPQLTFGCPEEEGPTVWLEQKPPSIAKQFKSAKWLMLAGAGIAMRVMSHPFHTPMKTQKDLWVTMDCHASASAHLWIPRRRISDLAWAKTANHLLGNSSSGMQCSAMGVLYGVNHNGRRTAMLPPQLTFECLDEGHTIWVEPKQPAASNIWVTKVHNNTQVIWGAVPRGRCPNLTITLP